MNPAQLSHYLTTLVERKILRSVMVWGPPGIGKSETIAAVAKQFGIGLIDLRLSQLAPTDLRGLPVADHESKTSRWYPPEFLPRQGAGILFLDEFNMAPPAIQGIAQQLILDRCVGNYTLPEGWHVWAAGNRAEDGAAVFSMPTAIQNRFVHVSVSATFESYRQWALNNGIDEKILAFLAFRPGLLHKSDPKNPAWPSPRSWTAANDLHLAGLSVESAVGPAAATEFNAWTQIYEKLPDLDSVLSGKGKSVAFPKEPSVRYASTIGLAVRATGAEHIEQALHWLIANADPEWIQLFLHSKLDTAKRDGTLGRISSVIAKEPRIKEILAAYHKLLNAQ